MGRGSARPAPGRRQVRGMPSRTPRKGPDGREERSSNPEGHVALASQESQPAPEGIETRPEDNKPIPRKSKQPNLNF